MTYTNIDSFDLKWRNKYLNCKIKEVNEDSDFPEKKFFQKNIPQKTLLILTEEWRVEANTKLSDQVTGLLLGAGLTKLR